MNDYIFTETPVMHVKSDNILSPGIRLDITDNVFPIIAMMVRFYRLISFPFKYIITGKAQL